MPDPARAAALITPQTRAIVLVSPNNPGGVAYPPALIRAFFELARARGLALIVDETYRDYLDSDGAPMIFSPIPTGTTRWFTSIPSPRPTG
jgi:aspartate/methionine/tyrosine aminotransferase